eukprot:1214513-Amphidinium_carterae.1
MPGSADRCIGEMLCVPFSLGHQSTCQDEVVVNDCSVGFASELVALGGAADVDSNALGGTG